MTKKNIYQIQKKNYKNYKKTSIKMIFNKRKIKKKQLNLKEKKRN